MKNNSDARKIRLRCHRYKKTGCRGTAYIQNNLLTISNKCQHEIEDDEIKRRKIETSMKDSAEHSSTSLRKIYDDNVVSSDCPDFEPSFARFRPTMKKRRMKALNDLYFFSKALEDDDIFEVES